MVTTRSTLILDPEDDGATESPAFGAWPDVAQLVAKDWEAVGRAAKASPLTNTAPRRCCQR